MGDEPVQQTLTNEPVRQALASVEAEIAELEPQYEALRARLMNLRRAAVSLRPLLGLEEQPDAGSSRGHGVGQARAEARTRAYEAGRAAQAARDAAEEAARIEALVVRNSIAHGVEPDEDVSSTERVIELLREREGRPVRRQDIYGEFERRGWIDPSWREPGAAVRMAIRRAVERDDVVQEESGVYRYKVPQPTRQRSVETRRAASSEGDA